MGLSLRSNTVNVVEQRFFADAVKSNLQNVLLRLIHRPLLPKPDGRAAKKINKRVQRVREQMLNS